MKPKGKRVFARRGVKAWDSNNVSFTSHDEWDYRWCQRNFGIALKPGETKEYVITEVK